MRGERTELSQRGSAQRNWLWQPNALVQLRAILLSTYTTQRLGRARLLQRSLGSRGGPLSRYNNCRWIRSPNATVRALELKSAGRLVVPSIPLSDMEIENEALRLQRGKSSHFRHISALAEKTRPRVADDLKAKTPARTCVTGGWQLRDHRRSRGVCGRHDHHEVSIVHVRARSTRCNFDTDLERRRRHHLCCRIGLRRRACFHYAFLAAHHNTTATRDERIARMTA